MNSIALQELIEVLAEIHNRLSEIVSLLAMSAPSAAYKASWKELIDRLMRGKTMEYIDAREWKRRCQAEMKSPEESGN